jgi:hypothetical protein
MGVFARMMVGLASEGGEDKVVMIDATYLSNAGSMGGVSSTHPQSGGSWIMALFAERVRWHIWEEVSPNGAPQGGLLKWTPAWNPTGTRSPPGIHPRSPARPLILQRFQALNGGF